MLAGAVKQLGGCLEAVLGQQQRFLAAAAAWEARVAVRRRQVHERAVAAASELLHARNALAEALAREQGLRADCEVCRFSEPHVGGLHNALCTCYSWACYSQRLC